MGSLQTITIAAGSGDTGTQALTKLKDNQLVVAENFIGSTAPTSPRNGQLWMDNTDTADYVPKLRENGAWVTVALKDLKANLDCNLWQLLQARAENLAKASFPTAAAAEAGRLIYDTTGKRFWLIKDAVRAALCEAVEDTTEIEVLPNIAKAEGPTTNPATATRDEIEGFLFTSTSEELTLIARVPLGWDGSNDIQLDLFNALEAAETANDDIEYIADWISITPGSGDATDKAETASAVAAEDIGANVNAKDVHVVTLVIDHDDATNTVAAGDILRITLRRNSVGGAGFVANTFLFGARLRFTIANAEY